jgi:glycosyltransferase involved in cell wall biosynthesis
MRVVHVSTHDVTGGAARAAFRLHEGLRGLGVDSTMFVAHKASTSPHVIQARPGGSLARLRARIRFARIQRDVRPYHATRPPGYEAFDDDRACDVELVRQLPPADIVHLHFVSGFIDHLSFLTQLPRNIPIVWTAHDMAPLTGGCHYDAGCSRFKERCGRCPQLGSTTDDDLSRRIWARKRRAMDAVRDRLHFVVASRWMEQEVRESGLCSGVPVTCIPFGLDCDVFRPIDKPACRTALGIDPAAKVVLFVSDSVSNRRKGLGVLLEALARLRDRHDILMLSVGKSAPPATDAVHVQHLGAIANDRLLAIAYNAADVFVAPSLQEAFGQTVIEAMACGVPVVGFEAGGIPDLIRHGITGFLVPPNDANGLATRLQNLLSSAASRHDMSTACRKTALDVYPLSLPAKRHEKLYREAGLHTGALRAHRGG